jgi:hypothetical protein
MVSLTAKELADARRQRYAWVLGHDTLYKFKGFQGDQRKHVLDVLRYSRVYLSSPDQFNDPYDSAPVIALAGDPRDPTFLAELRRAEDAIIAERKIDAKTVSLMRRRGGQSASALADAVIKSTRHMLVSSTRIFCLSQELLNPLQWAHYANGHRGVALHFSAQTRPFRLARQVIYRKARRPILIPLGRQSNQSIADRMVFIKGQFWKYEREYRVVAINGVLPGASLKGPYLDFDSGALTAITFGMKMPKRDRNSLLRAIDRYRPALQVYEVAEVKGQFGMTLNRIR